MGLMWFVLLIKNLTATVLRVFILYSGNFRVLEKQEGNVPLNNIL